MIRLIRRWWCQQVGHRIGPAQWGAFDHGYPWRCERCGHSDEGWRG